MDGLTLLHQARAAGLRVQAAGSQLQISGPKRAEPLVKLLAEHKAAVLAIIDLADKDDHWSERYTALTFLWSNGGRRDWRSARRLAWGDIQSEWHMLHGLRVRRWQCAGCQQPISGDAALDLPDDNRVHFEEINCLIAFGRRWRSFADARLIACGLISPDPTNDGL
jgi:hypothetical protein